MCGAFAKRFEILKQFLRRQNLYIWAPAAILLFLWFPFDWLSEVCPVFGVPFRMVFKNAHTHFVGHSVFFFLCGAAILGLRCELVKKPILYFAAAVCVALIQETIQAFFRHTMPDFTDYNAFRGDALGTTCAYVAALLITAVNAKRSKAERDNSPCSMTESSKPTADDEHVQRV